MVSLAELKDKAGFCPLFFWCGVTLYTFYTLFSTNGGPDFSLVAFF